MIDQNICHRDLAHELAKQLHHHSGYLRGRNWGQRAIIVLTQTCMLERVLQSTSTWDLSESVPREIKTKLASRVFNNISVEVRSNKKAVKASIGLW